MSNTNYTIVCVGTGVARRYHYKSESTLISTGDLFGMYYARLRTLGYKAELLKNQTAEHLMEMYQRHKDWARKGIVSSQLKLLVS